MLDLLVGNPRFHQIPLLVDPNAQPRAVNIKFLPETINLIIIDLSLVQLVPISPVEDTPALFFTIDIGPLIKFYSIFPVTYSVTMRERGSIVRPDLTNVIFSSWKCQFDRDLPPFLDLSDSLLLELGFNCFWAHWEHRRLPKLVCVRFFRLVMEIFMRRVDNPTNGHRL